MTEIWTQAALWMGLALVATLLAIWLRVATALSEIVIGTVAQLFIGAAVGSTLLAIWLRVATALSEIVIGTVAQLIIGAALGSTLLAADVSWLKFLAGAGAILLTFLAGAELDPAVFRRKWKQATLIGLVSFTVPFLGCTAIARWVLDWSPEASWLAGIAMSTTSVAVVYAVMLEFGLNTTEYGKVVLAACFITDLATVIGLGLIFAPFTFKTLIFLGVGVAAFLVLPWLTPRFFRRYGNRPSELEAKYLMLCLFGLGALATWADSEAVLPAYLIGMVLAGTVGKDHALVRRLRTLTFGLLTPFYFIRAGSLVSLPALAAAPAAFLILLAGKMATKIAGVYPVTRALRSPRQEGIYTTLLMSTGLTFGTISALFGLAHEIVTQAQYSALVAAVVGSAVVPTLIANAFFLPRHLLGKNIESDTGHASGAQPEAAVRSDL